MPNPLQQYYGTSSMDDRRVSSPLTGYYDREVSYGSNIPGRVQLNNQTLPNGGGTYNPAGDSRITPAPVVTGAPETPAAPANDFYEKYKDPKTGEVMSPEEYAIYLGNKIPKGNGEIPNYAGDAMTNPNESANQLAARARNLNNSRNDIATGTTDPYKVGNKSGIAYSPQELKAIESAYAGVYDPVLNDVFARLDDKQKEVAKQVARDDRIFATNEAIRQWQATTGTKSDGNGTGTKWSDTQLRQGAGIAGLSIEAYTALDNEVKNYFYNSPMGLNPIDGDPDKPVPMYEVFNSYYKQVREGDFSAADMAEMIKESALPEEVKIYTTYMIPAEPTEEGEGIDWFWKSKWLK